jgi:uncharacterized protein YjbI with pentapeptide repeats
MPNSDIIKLTTLRFIEKLIEGQDRFVNHDLSGVNFELANLFFANRILTINGSILIDANLTNVKFNELDASGVDFTRARLAGADFENANLADAIFDSATFVSKADNTNFSEASLSDAVFKKNFLYKVNFSSCYAFTSKFINCEMLKCDMSNIELTHSNIKDCIFKQTNLSQSVLLNSKFESCVINKTNFSDSCLSCVTFETTSITNCNFKDAILLRTKFDNVDLTNSNFEDAYIPGVDFRSSNLTDVNFKGVIEASFSKVKDRFREDEEDYLEDYDAQTYFEFEQSNAEVYSTKIKESCETIQYLLENEVLIDAQIETMLGFDTADNGISGALNFLNNYIEELRQEEVEAETIEYVEALIARIIEVERRIRGNEFDIVDDITNDSNAINRDNIVFEEVVMANDLEEFNNQEEVVMENDLEEFNNQEEVPVANDSEEFNNQEEVAVANDSGEFNNQEEVAVANDSGDVDREEEFDCLEDYIENDFLHLNTEEVFLANDIKDDDAEEVVIVNYSKDFNTEEAVFANDSLVVDNQEFLFANELQILNIEEGNSTNNILSFEAVRSGIKLGRELRDGIDMQESAEITKNFEEESSEMQQSKAKLRKISPASSPESFKSERVESNEVNLTNERERS